MDYYLTIPPAFRQEIRLYSDSTSI